MIFRGDLAALMRLEIGRGEVIYFFGCVAHAIYAPMVRKLNRGESAVVFTFGTLVAGFLCLLVWGSPAALNTNWLTLPAIVWICLAYVAIAASAMTFVLIQYASLRLPAAKVMSYTYLVPTWVILWELALGHGTPPATVAIGVALTVVALILLLKDEARDRPNPNHAAPHLTRRSAPLPQSQPLKFNSNLSPLHFGSNIPRGRPQQRPGGVKPPPQPHPKHADSSCEPFAT